ncbi:MAG: TolC family protein, partial [Planctomycetes bacterium]|nr:TolC family protein [Planctomycetota bacterium]
EGLYVRAIEHSHQVSVFSTLPLIRDTAVVEAEGEFDPRAFIESRLRHANEPVGSTLRTGGPTRFREDEWRVTGGVRKHTWTGADIELSQRVGVVDSNSLFFVPDDQAQTELSLSVTQPLLNRAGLEYNRSTVRIARLDGEIAMEEFRRQVGAHLLELTRAYWALYLQRGALVIRTRLAEETRTLLERLQSRRGVDTLESQVLKARAALAAREADTIRAAAAVRNAEARIASLVNDPDVQLVDGVELVPVLAPQGVRKQVELDQAARFALDNRAEIIEAVKQLQAGMVRLQMSESELLPVLDLLMEVSWQGLEGRSSTGRALRTQVDADGPSWTVGLLLDVPLGNRVANARHERRRLEVRQLTDQLRATVETLLLEVQVAVREVNVGWREQHARYHAMQARGAELEGLEQRGVLGADSPALGGLLVDELLGAQERLRDSEHAFLEAQVSYSLALANLDRAMGLMLQARDYRLERGADADGLPTLDLRAP